MKGARTMRRLAIAMGAALAGAPAQATYTVTTPGDTPLLGLLAASGMVLFMIVLLLVVGLLPAVIAFMRDHGNKWAILILTIVGGWTVIGWIAALVWAFLPRDGFHFESSRLDRIERLAALRDAGRLTEEEYQRAKTAILGRM